MNIDSCCNGTPSWGSQMEKFVNLCCNRTPRWGWENPKIYVLTGPHDGVDSPNEYRFIL